MAGFPPPTRPRTFDRRVLLAPLALLAVSLSLTWALAGDSSPEAEAEGDGATVAALVADPQTWVGRKVTITGTVEERYPSRSFAIGHETVREDVIVMTRGGAHEAALAEWPSGDVEVTGEVRLLEPRDEDILAGDMAVRRGQPVIVARDVPVRSQ